MYSVMAYAKPTSPAQVKNAITQLPALRSVDFAAKRSSLLARPLLGKRGFADTTIEPHFAGFPDLRD